MRKIRSMKSPSPAEPTPRPTSKSNNTSCIWTLDEIGEYANRYTTSCQRTYYDDQTFLEANDFSYCLFCGRKMELKYGKEG